MNSQFQIKVEVLQTSLLLENMTSNFLAALIGINKSPLDTYSFGNRSMALSFNQKILLLIDIGALESSTRVKFLTFMAIRNQFMHNILATSYEVCIKNCLSKEDGNYMTKYVQKKEEETDEQHLKRSVDELSNDVLKTTGNLLEKLKTKMGNEMHDELKRLLFDDLLSNVKHQKKVIEEKFVLDKEKSYSAEELVDITFDFLSKFVSDSVKETMAKHKDRYKE